MLRVGGNIYHFYRIKFQFLTYSTDFKKPCERKAKNAFAHVCKICIYAKFAYMQIISMCRGFKSNYNNYTSPRTNIALKSLICCINMHLAVTKMYDTNNEFREINYYF